MTEPTTEARGRPHLTLDLPEADVVFYPACFPEADADRLLGQLVETTEWRQDSMKMFGQVKPLPRLTAWYGDPGTRYVYSGIVNEPLPWTAALADRFPFVRWYARSLPTSLPAQSPN